MLALIGSVYKSDKSFYPQVLLEQCKYIIKGKETKRFITKHVTSEDESESENESEYQDESENKNENKSR